MTRNILPLLFVCLLLAGCASSDRDPVYVNDMEISDPWEEYNRAIFKFNVAVDEMLIEPVARGYHFILPDFAETGVRNVLTVLRSPVDFTNQILQGDYEGALDIATRTMINSSFGFFGFVDLAYMVGIPYEKEDLGQTLAVWGVEHGPYFVLPLYGGASVRDHLAGFVEAYTNPLRLYLYNIDEEEKYFILAGVSLISRRAALLETLDDLQKSSIDYYASVRSLYYQNRKALILDNINTEGSEPLPDIPEFDEEY